MGEEEETLHSLTLQCGAALPLHVATFKRTARMLSSPTDLTGLSRWWAGSLLASLLARRSSSVLRGAIVCELGCGASALLAATAAACGAAAAAATDGEIMALPLALRNLVRAAGARGAATAALPLRWAPAAAAAAAGEEAAVLRALGRRADVLLASEVLYRHRGGEEGWGFEEQARALFALAARLLQPGGCLLMVYTPRYPGMARGLRAAALAAGAALRTIARRAALTPELAATKAFHDTRLLLVCLRSDALQLWLERLGSPPAGGAADDSEVEEGGGAVEAPFEGLVL
jgi:hypothetical protein